MVKVGVIGCGYWGPKLARNFNELPDSSLQWVCDFRDDRVRHIKRLYPEVRITNNYEELLASNVDAVVLATPVHTHCRLALQALHAGKHVLIEKPIAASVREAEMIVETAEYMGRVAMVGHTFVYNPAVEAVRDIIASGELGDIYYMAGVRVNLGLFQPDINVLWDLAPHDISILQFIMGMAAEAVSARGSVCVQKDKGIHDIAYLSLRFPNDVLADVRVSWLDPVKKRFLTVVGSKKMLLYDDIADDKVVVFDKRVEIPPYSDTEQEFHASYHHGDGVPLPVTRMEPLRKECSHFIECIRSGRVPLTDAEAGLQVVRVLESADRSLHNSGSWEVIPWLQTSGPALLRT